MNLAQRLAARTDVPAADGCVPWLGKPSSEGYGRITVAGVLVYVHRLVYEIEVGPIPAGLTIDHTCRNRLCVNVAHMEPVTRAENTRRGAVARTLACPAGHLVVGQNRYETPSGHRRCRACRRSSMRRARDGVS